MAPLNGWACAVKICHGGMLEDTNSLDAAQLMSVLSSVYHMSHVMRKSVFRVCDQVRLKLACFATEYFSTCSRVLKYHTASLGFILSMQRTTKVLVRLCGCAGWSGPWLLAFGIKRFSHDVAHMLLVLLHTWVWYVFSLWWWCMLHGWIFLHWS